MIRKQAIGVMAVAVLVILLNQSWTAAQEPQTYSPPAPTRDPIARLNLTPEQRERIRAIRSDNKDERAAIAQRLKASNEALERALDADNPNEAEVESLLRDVATAQAASIRMRVFTELRIRRVLTTEQITVWRALRLEAARARRNEAPNPNSRRRIRSTPQTGFTPLFERRNQPPKSPRP